MSRITKSSGNVFRDLGFSAIDAEDLRLRSDLLIQLQGRIVALNEAQASIARRLEITQPRVSDLLRGKIDRFSLDALALFLRKLGAEVQIVVQQPDAFATMLQQLARTTRAATDATAYTWRGDATTTIRIQLEEPVTTPSAACNTQLKIAA